MSELIYTAQVANNDTVFKDLMELHVPAGSKVADVTFGKGVFWRQIPAGQYELHATDIDTGVDCRKLPYEDESMDCVVSDPPYTGGFFRRNPKQRAYQGSDFQEWYSSNSKSSSSNGSHASLMELYADAAWEAQRVLKLGGIYVVKCQDEVEDHLQHMVHVDLIIALRGMGFYCRDLFVVVRRTNPHGKLIKRQRHARKNHSYFLVFVKVSDKDGNSISPRR